MAGGFAETVVLAPHLVAPRPPELDHVQAAAMPVNHQTAHVALVRRARLPPGERVLVHGAGGGLGCGRGAGGRGAGRRGCWPWPDRRERRELAAAAGAHTVYGPDEWFDAVRADGGVDVIVDPVGGDVFEQSVRCLAPEGRLLTVGFTSGRIPAAAANRLLLRNAGVLGAAWRELVEAGPDAVRRAPPRRWPSWSPAGCGRWSAPRTSWPTAPPPCAPSSPRAVAGKVVSDRALRCARREWGTRMIRHGRALSARVIEQRWRQRPSRAGVILEPSRAEPVECTCTAATRTLRAWLRHRGGPCPSPCAARRWPRPWRRCAPRAWSRARSAWNGRGDRRGAAEPTEAVAQLVQHYREVSWDPYLDLEAGVLRNRLGITDPEQLRRAESRPHRRPARPARHAPAARASTTWPTCRRSTGSSSARSTTGPASCARSRSARARCSARATTWSATPTRCSAGWPAPTSCAAVPARRSSTA